MTYDGFCAVALAGTFVMLIGVTVGWWVDHHVALRDAWREYRRSGREIRRVRSARGEAMRRIAISLDIDAGVQRRFDSTPIRQADPSPRPRLTDYEYRAIAEGMEQT